MPHYVATRIIDAPIERVFAYRLDVGNLPAYNPNVAGVEEIGGTSPDGGRAYRFRLRIGPWIWTRVRLEVCEVERPSRLVFRIRSLMDAREECAFEPVQVAGRHGTLIRFDYTVESRGGRLAPLVDALFVTPRMRAFVERELDLLKSRLED